MPNKYPQGKGWNVPKQKYKLSNWSEYNKALKQRGRIDTWVSADAVNKWYEPDQTNTGTGAAKKYTDFAIIVCHQIRQVYRLPLRQSEGFINSIFNLMRLDIKYPSFSTLSKRLAKLNITCPSYSKHDKPDDKVAAITIDSTGLKRFGRDEWHQEKHKVSAKRSWRKLHIAVDQDHYIQGSLLTDRFVTDEGALDGLLDQVNTEAKHVSLDGAYDSNNIYKKYQINLKMPISLFLQIKMQ